MTASVAVASVDVVAAGVATASAIATLLLLGAAVGVAMKVRVMQTAPNTFSRAARRQSSPARLAQNLKHWGFCGQAYCSSHSLP